MDQSRIIYLVNQLRQAPLSDLEQLEWTMLLQDPANRDALVTAFEALPDEGLVLEAFDERLLQWLPGIMDIDKPRVRNEMPAVVHRVHFLKTTWFRYAAILLLITGVSTFLYLYNQPQRGIALSQQTIQPDIAPGGNKAVLTLADGSTIVLDSAANGQLSSQGNTRILKLNEGSLAYQAGEATGEIMYNTISTPKGGQYQIVLPDNTKVWLNAASSIRFPTAFGSERKVTITGEVYFETARDAVKPFIVETYSDKIQVLGTSFNINSYIDEPGIKTSLQDGKVQVNQHVLKPGQAYRNGQIIETNIEQDIAWKNNTFNFNNADLPAVLRQLSRWYNIDIRYVGDIPQKVYQGELSKDHTLTDILRILKQVGVSFEIKDKVLNVEGK